MISVVIPIFNEEESIAKLYDEVVASVTQLDKVFEIIFVDDGSTDTTLGILKNLAKIDKNVRIYSFRKNQGKAEALNIGFQKAKGEHIVTLDADLQDQPSEITKLYQKASEGYDLVCGWRAKRSDSLSKIISSKFFNFLTGFIWGIRLHDYNCGLKLYTKDAAKSLQLYGGLHRFIPALVFQKGFRVTEVAIVHEKRKFGKSKFGFSKLWRDMPDIFSMFFLTKYSNRPLHFFGPIGVVMVAVGFGILGYLTIIHFQGQSIGTRPLLFFGMLLILSGFQVFFTGFLADLAINISRNKSVTDRVEVLLRFSTD